MRTLPRLRFFEGRGRSPVLGFAVFLCAAWAFSSHAWDAGYDLAVQADGKFVIVGGGASGELALARYYPDGGLDFGFGVNGRVLTDSLNGFREAVAVALQADGKIVVVGNVFGFGNHFDFAVARYHSDGRLDESFGDGGLVTTDFAGLQDLASDVAVQSDGKIVVAGSSNDSSFQSHFAIARYHPDGRLDDTFGTAGQVVVETKNAEFGDSVVIQPDGKILVAGTWISEFEIVVLDGFRRLKIRGFFVARFDTGGSLDPAFGTDGRVITDFPGMNISAECLRLQADGKIVVSGRGQNAFRDFHANPPGFGMARYLADGSLDDGFGEGGLVTDIREDSFLTGGCLGIQPDGKIILMGSDQTAHELVAIGYQSAVVGYRSPGNDFQLVRFLPDGTPDDSFTEGRIDFFGSFDRAPLIEEFPSPFPKTRTNDVPAGIEVLPDGKILVAGSSDRDFAVAKFERDGALDPVFGKEGKVVTDLDRYQPDSQIRAPGHERIGQDIYHPNGIGQNIRVVNRRGHFAGFRFFVENDGTENDAITLTASRKRERFRVRYYRMNPPKPLNVVPLPPIPDSHRRENVTAQLKTSGLDLLLSGPTAGEVRFEARVRSRKGGTRLTTLEICSRSERDPLKKDTVRALVILGK